MQSTQDTRGCYKSLRKTTVAWQMRFGWPVAPAAPSRDFIAIAELRIVDEHEFESASREISLGSVKDLETVCRGILRRHLPAMANMRREGQLLLLKFDDQFYD